MLPRYATMGSFSAIVCLATALPVFAHKVKTATDVGATLHIEPNDHPRAREPSLTWFALTRKGGQIIPLAECNCNLAVYSQPFTQNSSPLLEPPLKAISAERYQGIPGAEVVFPQAGAYRLQLTGSPKAAGSFLAFELSYDVNVVPGVVQPSLSPTVTQLSPQPQAAENQWLIAIAFSALVLGISLAAWIAKKTLK